MGLLEVISGLACANEGKAINLSGGHDRRHGLASTSGDNSNNTRREAIAEQLESGEMAQNTDSRELHHNAISHNNSGDQSSVGFVEWVVEGSQAKNNSDRCSADLNLISKCKIMQR